jgi:hypothetical protein
VAGSAEKILEKLERIAKDGANFVDLREKWLLFFQTKLLGFYGIGEKTEGLDLISVKKIIDLLIDAGGKEKLTQISQLPLEMVVVDFLVNKSTSQKSESLKVESPKIEVEKKIEMTDDVAKIAKRWGEVLVAVKPFNHSVEAFLRAARPLSLKGNLITLEVFYKFHKERLEEAKNREIVLKGLRKVFNKEFEFKCIQTIRNTEQRVTSTEEKKAEEIFV